MKNINEAKALLKEIEEKKNAHLREIQNLEDEAVKIKLQLAELILNNEEDHKPQTEPQRKPDNTQAFVRIEFKPGGKTYDYLWAGDENPGEYVLITGYHGEQERVRVIDFFRAVPNARINYKYARPIE